MRNYFSFIMLIFSLIIQGQSLVLDYSFGTNGTSTTNDDIKPTNGYFENNQYYLFGNETRFARYNYDGSKDTSFGNYGFFVFGISGEYPTLKNFKMHGGQCYGFGKSESPSTLTDGIIVRLTTDGQLDPTFGDNGVVRFNLGSHEYFNDILINTDGSFYAIGVKQTNDSDGRVLLCKFLENGTLDTSFNSTGSKVFTYTQMVKGISIFRYQDAILLGNWTRGTGTNSDIFLQKIDYNGNLMSGFGTGGNLRIPIPVDSSSSPSNFQGLKLVGNRIYCQYYYGVSFTNQGYGMYVFDITNPSTPQWYLSSGNLLIDSYVKPFESGKVIIARGVNCISISACSTSFTLKQYNADGTLDTAFDNDGVYNYDFSSYPNYTEAATFFYQHTDGRIFLAGVYGALTMLRIGLPELSTPDLETEVAFSVYPNPSSKVLYINNKNNAILENVSISDILGKRIEVQITNNNTIDIANLSKGIYFLSFTTNGNPHSVKFIKS